MYVVDTCTPKNCLTDINYDFINESIIFKWILKNWCKCFKSSVAEAPKSFLMWESVKTFA